MGPHQARHAAAPAAVPQQTYGETWPPYIGQPYRPSRRRKRRVFVWVFLAVQALFLAWVIAGAASGGGIHGQAVAYCHGHPSAYISFAECVSAYGGGSKAGTAIGVGLIIALWAVVDVILGISYGVYRLAKR